MRVALALLALVVILSFFLAPWVAITPTDFLPDTIQRVLAIADSGLRKLAPAPVPGLLELLETVTVFPPFRMLLTGFLNPWMWIVLLAPLVAAGITLLLALLSWALHSEVMFRWGGWVGACGGGLAATLLIVSLPVIEHLGLGGIYLARLGLALAGLHLAWGYWLTLVAVLGMTVVGVLCVVSEERAPRKKSASIYGRSAPTYRR
jgi:hypothetical protein